MHVCMCELLYVQPTIYEIKRWLGTVNFSNEFLVSLKIQKIEHLISLPPCGQLKYLGSLWTDVYLFLLLLSVLPFDLLVF